MLEPSLRHLDKAVVSTGFVWMFRPISRNSQQKGSALLTEFFNIAMALMDGAKTTLFMFFIVIVLSVPLGFVFTMMARCPIPPLRWLADGFIYLMRGTPLLLQLLFIYLGLPFIPVIGPYLRFERLTAAVIGFVLNYSAYFAEIYRGGLLAVDKGQYEAAQVLGLSKMQTTFKVVLPQMFRVALPSITNESITLVKDTSLLYAVSVPELLHFSKVTVSRTAESTAFLVAAIIYLVMNTLLTLLFKRVEKKLEF